MNFLSKVFSYVKELSNFHLYGMNIYLYTKKNNSYFKEKLEILEKKALEYCSENKIPVEFYFKKNEFSYAGCINYYNIKDNVYNFIRIRINSFFFNTFLSDKNVKTLGNLYVYSRQIHTLYHEIGHYIGIKYYNDFSEIRANYEGAKLAVTFLSDLDIILLNISFSVFTHEDDSIYINTIEKDKTLYKSFKKIIKDYFSIEQQLGGVVL